MSKKQHSIYSNMHNTKPLSTSSAASFRLAENLSRKFQLLLWREGLVERVAMWIGNIFAAIPFIYYQGKGVPGVMDGLGYYFPLIFVFALSFNFVYICQCYWYSKRDGINLWTRW